MHFWGKKKIDNFGLVEMTPCHFQEKKLYTFYTINIEMVYLILYLEDSYLYFDKGLS